MQLFQLTIPGEDVCDEVVECRDHIIAALAVRGYQSLVQRPLAGVPQPWGHHGQEVFYLFVQFARYGERQRDVRKPIWCRKRKRKWRLRVGFAKDGYMRSTVNILREMRQGRREDINISSGFGINLTEYSILSSP